MNKMTFGLAVVPFTMNKNEIRYPKNKLFIAGIYAANKYKYFK